MPDSSLDSGALVSELRVAVIRLARRIKSRRASNDLPERYFTVLYALAAKGPTAPGVLADREHVRPPSMSRTVAALADLGLVTRQAHPLDRRQLLVALTPAGKAEVDETLRRRDQWLSARLNELPDDDRDVLARAATIMERLTD